MDGEQASRFVSSLVKSIQALCNGYIDFSSSIEVIGHIHLNIDRTVKLDYVLTEEVSKSISEGATVFASHSYHSQPPSNVLLKGTDDTSNRSRQKQTRSDESDPVIHKRSSSHFNETNETSQVGSFVDNTNDNVMIGRQENKSKFCHSQESSEKQRRNVHSQSFQRTSLSVAKRIRQSECHAELNKQNFEVIEIKEEPDDEPTVFFGNTSSHEAAGQDLQTPDFSNVVMESLDRVGKVEGTDLVADHDMQQQQPFPIMMHANSRMSSSSASLPVPGPSLSNPQAQSLASTSGSFIQTADIPGLLPSAVPGSEFEEIHLLQTIPRTGKTPWPQKPCIVCKQKGLLRKSRFFCAGCAKQPGFCKKGTCFSDFHSMIHYWNSQQSMPNMDKGENLVS